MLQVVRFVVFSLFLIVCSFARGAGSGPASPRSIGQKVAPGYIQTQGAGQLAPAPKGYTPTQPSAPMPSVPSSAAAPASQVRSSELAGSAPAAQSTATAPPLSESQQAEKDAGCTIATDAKLALNVLYKSCDASETSKAPLGSGGGKDKCGNQGAKSGDIKSTFSKNTAGGGQCGMGGMPEYSQAGGRIQVNGNTVTYPNATTDCSAFVCGVLARSNMYVSPGQKCTNATTEEMKNWGEPCFKKVADKKLKAGDIIWARQGSEGHTVVVTETQGGQETSDLNKVQIAHAAGKDSGILQTSLAGAGGKVVAFLNGGGEGAVLRHVSKEENPLCAGLERMVFQGEECVKSCRETNQSIVNK